MDKINILAGLILELLTWRSILDILVMAVLIFFLYRTFVRLGTVKIVLGIILTIGVFILASFLDLTGIRWIYSNVSHVAIIAIIIIFQPELRKIFEKAASLKRSETGETGIDLIRIVTDTLFALAEQNRGAIIVFPGKEPVREWVNGGQELNAEPSHSLIMSIFDPNSPGHDGAMIVMNGKLTHFGVRLPVSETNQLSSEYGTRHHAAMGLSERSDALVLVVSEERGKVSIFHDGEMISAPEKEKVVSAIKNHWNRTASYPISLSAIEHGRRVGSQMLISLFLAAFLLLTLIISKGELIEKVISAPVEFAAAPRNTALVGEKISEVRLHLIGSKPDLDSLSVDQLTVKIDLSKSMPGEQEIGITDDNIKLPKGVRLLDVQPSSLVLKLASIVGQDVTIKPQLVGSLPAGLELKSITVVPEKVRALAPLTEEGAPVVNITTTPIYMENIPKTTHLFCKIIAPANIQPNDKRWPDVEVILEVASLSYE